MKRGPKPKPYLVKLAEGFPGHRKCDPGIQLPNTQFEPPFPLDSIALAEWNRVILTAPWLRETESVAIADRCLCFQRIVEAEEIIDREGMIIQGHRGEVTHPALRTARDYRSAMQRWDLELGLMPSNRVEQGPKRN